MDTPRTSPQAAVGIAQIINNLIMSRLSEVARLLVRVGHVASIIVNTNHSIVRVSDEYLHKN
jgi:hypothetical protein